MTSHFVHNILVDDFLIQNYFYFNSHRQNRWPKQNLRMSYPNEDLYHSRRAKIVIHDKTSNLLIQTNIYATAHLNMKSLLTQDGLAPLRGAPLACPYHYIVQKSITA